MEMDNQRKSDKITKFLVCCLVILVTFATILFYAPDMAQEIITSLIALFTLISWLLKWLISAIAMMMVQFSG
jgi:hypothetical protein